MIRRREFIAGLGSAAAWPVVARAQQALPVVGVLIGGTAQPDGTGFVEGNMAALRKGLSETGFVEGNNVEILLLGAERQYDRLPALAAELVRRRVAAIFALWNVPALVAKSATETLPVVFAVGRSGAARLGCKPQSSRGQRHGRLYSWCRVAPEAPRTASRNRSGRQNGRFSH